MPVKYFAPEQMVADEQRRPYDKATDVWTYGITLWEIFSKGKILQIKRLMQVYYQT